MTINAILQCSSLYLKAMEVVDLICHTASFVDLRFSILMDFEILK